MSPELTGSKGLRWLFFAWNLNWGPIHNLRAGPSWVSISICASHSVPAFVSGSDSELEFVTLRSEGQFLTVFKVCIVWKYLEWRDLGELLFLILRCSSCARLLDMELVLCLFDSNFAFKISAEPLPKHEAAKRSGDSIDSGARISTQLRWRCKGHCLNGWA